MSTRTQHKSLSRIENPNFKNTCNILCIIQTVLNMWQPTFWRSIIIQNMVAKKNSCIKASFKCTWKFNRLSSNHIKQVIEIIIHTVSITRMQKTNKRHQMDVSSYCVNHAQITKCIAEPCVMCITSSKYINWKKRIKRNQNTKDVTWGSTIQPWYRPISRRSNMAHSRVNSKSSILYN